MSRGALRYSSVAAMPDGMQQMLGTAVRPEFPVRPANEPRTKSRRAQPEHEAQVAFFKAIRELAEVDRRYALAERRTFAVPNGARTSKSVSGRLKAEGLRAGVSDIFCAMPVRGKHGLFMEMKAPGNYPDQRQRAWLNESYDLEYAAHCCVGASDAFDTWKAYVEGSFR